MSRCSSCKGAFPEGCSACRTYTMGRITFTPAHVCSNCMRGLPCDMPRSWHSDQEWKASEPSLSASIAAVIRKEVLSVDSRSSELM